MQPTTGRDSVGLIQERPINKKLEEREFSFWKRDLLGMSRFQTTGQEFCPRKKCLGRRLKNVRNPRGQEKEAYVSASPPPHRGEQWEPKVLRRMLWVGRVWTGQFVYPEDSWTVAGDSPSCDRGKRIEQLGDCKAFSRTRWAVRLEAKPEYGMRMALPWGIIWALFYHLSGVPPEVLLKGPFTLKGLWTWWSMKTQWAHFSSLLSGSTPTEANAHSLSCHNCANGSILK